MNRLDRIQRVSRWLRHGLLALTALLAGGVILALLTQDQTWLSFGDEQFNALIAGGEIGPGVVMTLVTPLALLLLLGVYWLQRLFGEYQQGHFFTDSNMRCYLWLVWLKAAGFVYSLLWPLLAISLAPEASRGVGVTIEAGTAVELILLLLIVHLLREAQQVHDENQAFI